MPFSGSFAPCLHPNPPSEDEIVKRKRHGSDRYPLAKHPFAERIRHIVQIASPLSRSIRHPIPWCVADGAIYAKVTQLTRPVQTFSGPSPRVLCGTQLSRSSSWPLNRTPFI